MAQVHLSVNKTLSTKVRSVAVSGEQLRIETDLYDEKGVLAQGVSLLIRGGRIRGIEGVPVPESVKAAADALKVVVETLVDSVVQANKLFK